MNDEQMDDLLRRGPDMSAELSAQIRAQILRDTKPVKPMRSGLAYALGISGVCGVVALVFAALLGFKGWRALPPATAVEVVGSLAVIVALGSAMVARAMRPGSGNLHSVLLGLLAAIAYEGLVFGLFRDYSTVLFVHRGLVCLALGVLCALVAAVPVWVIARRGLVVEPVKAGALMGLVCGLAGLTALTLHCDVLSVPHAGIWHGAVILVCIGLGALAGRFATPSLQD